MNILIGTSLRNFQCDECNNAAHYMIELPNGDVILSLCKFHFEDFKTKVNDETSYRSA